jgi:cellulose synthase/poly-beta-1,6-N-acetylglucosamine synthase-like glycosyltransferase
MVLSWEVIDLVSVIIPSHNEEEIIAKTLESILNQTEKPENIIVCLDNCTDRTKEIAQMYDVEIFETVDNKNKKAGAINQVLDNYTLNEYVLIMDADTVLDKNVIKEGIEFLNKNDKHAAVCSRAGIIKPKFNSIKEKIIWQLQHIEYSLFDAERIETKGKIKVSHGMCTMYRVKSLMEIYLQRGIIYLDDCLTEDYELTLTLKKNGWKISTNLSMKAWTDVPLSIRELWKQRYRWLLGGIDSLKLHGLKKHTMPDIFSHMLFIVLVLIQLYLVVNAFLYGNVTFINKYVGILFSISVLDNLYRSKYIQDKTKVDIIYIISVIPLLIYSFFNIAVLIYSYWLSLRRKKIYW